MKTKLSSIPLVLAVLATGLYSCQKGTVDLKADSSTATTSTSDVAATQAIALGLTTTAVTSTKSAKDSLYMIGCYPPKGHKDSVTFSALPTAISTYLTANYAGYTFVKAYKTTDSLKVIDGYVVQISFNSKPVGLKFTAAGVFVKVLEQREGPDLRGKGWHEGGRFGERDGHQRDTIAIPALPAVVKTYFTANYPTDTLLHAAINTRDTSYVLISKNKGLFATVISSTGKLIKRVQIDIRPVRTAALQTALPAVIATYLTATYPAYVFDKAYIITQGTATQGYVVFISANSTRHAVKFNASGVFVSDVVIR